MRINLSGIQTRMTKQRLQRADIRSILQHQRRPTKGHTILLLIQSIKQPNHSSVQIRFAAAKKEAADLEPVLIFWFSLKANAKGLHREPPPRSPSITTFSSKRPN
jgi:hypothetical protein